MSSWKFGQCSNGLKKTDEEIERCISLYLEIKSIEKVAKVLKWSKSTVNKYVKQYSKFNNNGTKKRSIYKIDLDTKEKFFFGSIYDACKENHYTVDNISKCLHKHTLSAYGFGWCFTEEVSTYKAPAKKEINYKELVFLNTIFF